MNDPIKVIYKYKNDNNKIQYQYYIFVGPLIPQNLRKIFTKIEKLNFFTTIITLSDKEINQLEKFYGENWYSFFFLSEHLTFSIDSIVKSSQKRSDIISKFGKEWYDKHISKNIYIKRSEYSFGSTFEKNMYIKYKNSLSESSNDIIDDVNDYTTKNLNNIVLEGGKIDDENEEQNDNENPEPEFDETYEEKIDTDEFYDIDELTNNYKESDVLLDENPESIKNLISKALEKADADIEEKKNRAEHFDKYKSNVVYDDVLKRNSDKKFIYSFYIFKNDTIKVIKQKISLCIENNDKYSKVAPYIIPSRMYLWSEYEFNCGKTVKNDKVMLGHKWIKKNELLSVDIEPNNNLTIYEKLKGNLKLLNDSMKKYGSKIRFEDDENNILDEYEDYYSNNEIFMIDVYNELTMGYKATHEDIKNLFQVYIKIYFPNITFDDFLKIIEYVNCDNEKKHFEENIILKTYQNIFNDMVLEREIMNTVEQVKIDKIDYRSLLKSNYIIQAVIHLNLKFQSSKTNTINLYKIFDSFIVSEKYPFLQYQINTGNLSFKFYQENKDLDKDAILSKWFENSPYGISFKIKINNDVTNSNKYITVSLLETGRMEYKTTWKEDDKATIDDIIKTYDYIKDLIKKINSENMGKSLISEPDDNNFKYAFINSIQHFEMPDNKSINHNELSDFARFFFPYVSVVIDPKKRMSKKIQENTKSKYGTYLRYKRISKFDNESKIENRIIYFLRNYEFVPKLLATEISKQFNITETIALKKIEEVITKYPLLKKSRKILKKLQNIPKFKPPGVAIDIQGKKRENYKIRIDGARSRSQLNSIIDFMTMLLWLYYDTYIVKNPERVNIKNMLKTLTNIAVRRNRVDDVVIDKEVDTTNVKELTKLDQDRLGKKVKGDKWARICQNSADKFRRPDIYTDETFSKMESMGYKLNKDTNEYERKVTLTKNGSKRDVTIKAAKFSGSQNLYYTCSPEVNGEYMYIGFLSRSFDTGVCIPCCFKKDPSTSNNKFKRNFHMQCLGKNVENSQINNETFGDKLYILQDTNKMVIGRFGYMYKYLDYYFNTVLNKTKVVKNNYLTESKTGYYMKYGSNQDKNPFLNAVSACIDISLSEIYERIESAILSENVWSFANGGDLKTQFKTREKYIDILKNNDESVDHYYTDDIISVPGVLLNNGLNTYIFERKETKTKVDFVLLCKNVENIIYYSDPLRTNILLIKEGLNYFPIMLISKTPKDKNVMVKSKFDYNDEIIQHVMDYLKLSCKTISFESINTINAKNTYYKMFSNSNIKILYQIIDNRNKCTSLIAKTNNSTFVIPVKPSGALYNIPITNMDNKFLHTIISSKEFLENYYSILNIKPLGFVYSKKTGSNYVIDGLYIENQISMPVISETLTENELNKIIPNCILIQKNIYEDIDREIEKGNTNYEIDDRINEVRKREFYDEHYELFRYEISNYLNLTMTLKNNIIKILQNDESSKQNDIKMLLLKHLSQELYEKLYGNKSGGGKFLEVNNEEVNTNNYVLKNTRDLCIHNKNSNDCNKNIHCVWNRQCMYRVSDEKLLEYISRLASELTNNITKSKEILNIDDYYVMDVININNFTYREKQKIVKSDNMNIKKILSEFFGESNIPIIGKKRIHKSSKTIYEENTKNPIEKVGKHYYQSIVNNNSLFRAYSNGIYWIKNNLSDVAYRNLGYYSDLQTELANTFKAYIYTWINNIHLLKTVYEDVKDIIEMEFGFFIEEYRTRIFMDKEYYYLGIVDLLIINYQHHIPVIIYDYYDSIKIIIDNGIKYNNLSDDKSMTLPNYDLSQCIKIKYKAVKLTINTIPESIQVIY